MLLLYASEIAIITGNNKYQKLSDYLIKLWSKFDNNDFKDCVLQLEQKHKVKFVENNDIQNIKNIEEKCGVSIQKQLNSIKNNTKNSDEVIQKRNELLKNIDDKVMDKTMKKQLKKSVENITNTNYGIVNEDKVLNVYSKNNHLIVYKICAFQKRKITKNLYIGGKIDGLTENGEIVEIKNRMYKLFYKMRDYEKIQLQSYLHIFKLNRGFLVENHNQNINVLEEIYDKQFMDNIIHKLKQFEIFFYDFMNNIDLKTLLLFGDDDLKEKTLHQLFIKYNIF